MTTRTPARAGSAAIRRVAARPSTPGIRMSISTTSGPSSRGQPDRLRRRRAASPTTSMSACASSSARNPARTSAWSSASRTRITSVIRSRTGSRALRPGSRRPGAGRRRARRRARPPARACRAGRCRRSPALARPAPAAVVGRPRRSAAVGAYASRTVAVAGAGVPGRRWSAPPARSGTRPGRPRRAAAGRCRRPRRSPAGRPAEVRATSASSRVQPGRRRRAARPRRRAAAAPSTERSSPSASLLACLIAVSAVRACSGCSSIRCSATPACTLISEMLCASTSCSSRAIAIRSSPARRRASSAAGTAELRRPLPAGLGQLDDHAERDQPGGHADGAPPAGAAAGRPTTARPRRTSGSRRRARPRPPPAGRW